MLTNIFEQKILTASGAQTKNVINIFYERKKKGDSRANESGRERDPI